MSDTDTHRAIIDRHLTAYNGFDVPGMLDVLHRDVEFRNVAGSEITATAQGRHAFRTLAGDTLRLPGRSTFAFRDDLIVELTDEG